MAEIIRGALASASKHVRIVTPYFLPDDGILTALAIASMRGIEVDIVLIAPEATLELYVSCWSGGAGYTAPPSLLIIPSSL